MQNNQTLVIGLVAVAVLLAVAVGVVVYTQSQAIPAASPAATAPAAAEQAPAASGAMGGAAAPAATSVDPKSATKVPKDMEPKDFVEGYYKACEKGDWEAAFEALPADKKTGNSPDALKQQVTGYDIKSYALTSATAQGDSASVTVDQVTGSFGTFENTWTFTKKDGVWYVSSKAVTGMK